MIQFHILNGKLAGRMALARQFPLTIGRAEFADLRLEELGVWDRHVELRLVPEQGFRVALLSEALGSLNGEPFRDAPLRNGDIVQIGEVRLQFWLSATHQPDLAWCEWLTWTGLGMLSLLQVGLVYWLY